LIEQFQVLWIFFFFCGKWVWIVWGNVVFCSMHFTSLWWVLLFGLLLGQVSWLPIEKIEIEEHVFVILKIFCFWIFYVFIFKCLMDDWKRVGFVAEISCWMWTGERQSTKMRIKYLEAALKQDIEFFDTEVRTSDVVFAINTDAVMVQDAISEKVRWLNKC